MLVAIMLVLAAGGSTLGGQLLVDGDGSASYRTIQGAIDAARFGDTIVIRPGIYEEQLQLRAGITLRGSGIGATVVRFAYGYDPLVSAQNVSQCVVENLTIERAPSLLSAEAVSIVNASVTFIGCNVTGGSFGISVSGSAGRLVFMQGAIVENATQGISAGEGTDIRVSEARIADNRNGGISARSGTKLQLDNVEVSGNGSFGVSVSGAGSGSGTFDVEVSDCLIAANDGPGIEAVGSTALRLTDTRVVGNRGHALRLEDDASATCRQCRFEDGGGMIVSGRARLDLRESTMMKLEDPAIRWAASSSGDLYRVSILYGAGSGVTVSGNAYVTVEQTTIARNEGAGVSVTGGTLELARCIVVLNRAYGVEVCEPGVLRSRSNNVWGNTPEEFLGGDLRPDDLSVPPSFVSLETGNVALRPDSACLSATVPGGALGSAIDPRMAAGVYGGIVGSWMHVTDWGGGLKATVRLAVDGGGCSGQIDGTAALSGALTWSGGELGVSADRRPTGTMAWTSWLFWDTTMRIGTINPDEPADVSLALSTDVVGRASGDETWLAVDIAASLLLETLAVDVGVSRSIPAGASLERIDVAVGGTPWAWRVSMILRDLSPVRGELSFDRQIASRVGDHAFSGSIGLFPTVSGQVCVTTALPRGSIGFGAAWGVDDPLRLNVFADDDPLGVDVAASWIESRGASEPMQLEIEVGKTLDWGRLGGRVVLGGGVRLEVDAAIEVDALRANQAPAAGFAVLGEESENPLTLWLDAAASRDPDGGDLTYDWSFGDGETGSGVVVVHTFPMPGAYSVVLTVTDAEGAASQFSQTLDIGGRSGPDATARFVWFAEDATGRTREGEARIGDTLIVDAGQSASEDRIVEFAWDVGGDGIIELRTGDPAARLPLSGEGAIAVVLRVTDASGRTGVISDVIEVVPRVAPAAAAGYSPLSPLVGETIQFTDLSTDSDGEIVHWAWSFGDGSRSDERHPRHAYAEAGAYTATLEVTDHEGLTHLSILTIEVASSSDAVIPTDVWVLVIGISDYETVSDLRYGREDAIAVARWALSAGVPADHLRLLLDRQEDAVEVAGLPADVADLLHVREALGWLRRETGEGDLVIVSFSGHGAQAEDDDGDEEDGWDELFVLRDTIAGAEAETALRDDELAAFVARIPSQRIVLLLDTCFSGGAEAGGRTVSGQRESDSDGLFATDTGRWDDLASSSTIILAAAAEGQIARESDALQHGVFTHFLLEGVAGEADADGDDRVTVAEAAAYVAPRVDAFVFSWLGVHQQPELTGRGDPAVVFARLP